MGVLGKNPMKVLDYANKENSYFEGDNGYFDDKEDGGAGDNIATPGATATPGAAAATESDPATLTSGGTSRKTTTETTTQMAQGTPGVSADDEQPFAGATYDDLWKYLNRDKPESDEDVQKRRKREKAEGIVAGVSDMARALSNLWFTSKGAPNMYEGKGMTDAVKERFDKEKADRDAKDKEWYNRVLQFRKMQEDEKAAANKLKYDTWKQQRQEQIDSFNQEYKQKELEYKDLLYQGKREEAEAKLKEMQRLNDARIEYYSKLGDAAQTKAAKYGSKSGGGGGSGGKYPYYDEDGNVQYAPSKQAADFYNGKNGYSTNQPQVTNTEKKNAAGRTVQQTTQKKDKAAVDHQKAAQKRAEHEGKKKQSPTGGGSSSGGKKKSPTR